ncbi:DUF4826 family protein [Alteromonas halophila]|uniref:DUF4826 domain-containing protein n=1 Tax=Alteromonas halophila TaxID=516698 RepID=A0A918JNJ6_9ALTE|nr:DUF4826 family protein [Alteromonas halophila]GGW89146.1 DUF4826 domain-containing protein [Alteromonas halophila]
MSEYQESGKLTQQEHDAWVREQFQRANKHLAENGVLFDTVNTNSSRYLAPFVAVWKIRAQDKKSYWVICGDLPADFTIESNAENARDAIRYFSMHWQVKAENIRQSGIQDKVQQDYANLLQSRAEGLFDIYEMDKLWNPAKA